MSRSLASQDDQRVTFVELFFDPVVVFSVAQVVGLLHVPSAFLGYSLWFARTYVAVRVRGRLIFGRDAFRPGSAPATGRFVPYH